MTQTCEAPPCREMLVRENDCGRGANFIADTYAVLLSAKVGPEESLSSNNGWTGSEGIQVPNPSSPSPGLKQCFRKIAQMDRFRGDTSSQPFVAIARFEAVLSENCSPNPPALSDSLARIGNLLHGSGFDHPWFGPLLLRQTTGFS